MLQDLHFKTVSDDSNFTSLKLAKVSSLRKLDFVETLARNQGIEVFKVSNIASYLGKDAYNVRGFDTLKARFGEFGELCTTPKGMYMIFSRVNARENSPYLPYAQSILLEMLDRCEPFMDKAYYTKKEVKTELGLGAAGFDYREGLARTIFHLDKFGNDLSPREYAACIILDKRAKLKDLLLGLAAEAEMNGAPRPQNLVSTVDDPKAETDLSWLD